MTITPSRIRRAVLFAALAAASPAHATLKTYQVTVPALGSGTFSYDDSTITDGGSGDITAPLTGFSFLYDGWTFTLADASSYLAWFSDLEGSDFLGLQYIGAHAASDIEFSPGFGSGDLGTFSGNGGAPAGDGPIALADADFTLQAPAGVPEPGSLALLGAGLAGWRGVRAQRSGKAGSE